MKQKRQLNPKLIKIVTVLTIFLSSFYYSNLSTYSKVLKGLAFCILIISTFLESVRNKARKKKNDDFLLCLIGFVMWLTNRLEEAIILLFVFQLLEYLKELKPIPKKTIWIKKKNKKEEIALSEIKKDMILILHKGEILPVDGYCIEEKAKSQKKFSTKTVDKILSGTIIKKDNTEVRALENYKDSKWGEKEENIQQIYKGIEEENKRKEKMKRKILIVIGISLILIPNFITQKFEYFSIYIGTVVLLFATQTSFQYILETEKKKTVQRLFSENIRINNFQNLKKLKNIKNIIFEKTGTLTLGEFRITSVKTKNEQQFLKYLNYVEYNSHHPIADTIKNYKKISIDVKKIKDFKETPNRGVECTVEKKHLMAGNIYFFKEKGINLKKEAVIGTVIYLVVDHTYLGNIVLSDSIKSSIKGLTQELRDYGIKNFSILSGDNEIINKAIGQELDIKDQYSNLTVPEKKFWIQHLMEQKKGKTMFIGNEDTKEDILKLADVSLILQKSEKTNENSDFWVVNNQLETIPNLFQISKDFRRKNYKWISFFIGLRGIWILLAFMESLPLWLPIIIEELIVLGINFLIKKY